MLLCFETVIADTLSQEDLEHALVSVNHLCSRTKKATYEEMDQSLSAYK